MDNILSCDVILSTAAMSRQFARMFIWVSGTAFGRASEPEVNRIAAVSGTRRGMTASPR